MELYLKGSRTAETPMSRGRLTLFAVVALLLITVVGAAAWRFALAADVPVTVAAPGAIAVRVVGPGAVQARTSVTLSARINATVRLVFADVGDSVREGQLLATLDDRDLRYLTPGE